MIADILEILGNFIFLALHIGSTGFFPKPMTKKEEAENIEKAKNGDIEARNKLVEHNLRLVVHIIKKYYADRSDRDDLVSIGTIGLIKGINSFDPDKGVRLATYAARCIENEILMYFRSARKTERDVSMYDPIDTDNEGNPLTFTDIVYTEDTIADDLDDKLQCIKIRELVNEIADERDRQILFMRYGLDGKEPMPQREVAKKLNISRSYVSRIETRLLKMLRGKLER